MEHEIGRVLEDTREEAVQRSFRTVAPRLEAVDSLCVEVGIEPPGGHQGVRRRQMRRQQAERTGPLADEVPGQRPVAVERRVAATAGDDLERHLVAIGSVRCELPRGLLAEVVQR